jgi:hypothetical protein
MSKFSRRSFLRTAGAAAGAAMIGVAPAIAGTESEQAAELVPVPSPLPHEPLVAYVRDIGKAEVSVVFGKHETTYRDPALVKRLVNAARRHGTHGSGEVA